MGEAKRLYKERNPIESSRSVLSNQSNILYAEKLKHNIPPQKPTQPLQTIKKISPQNALKSQQNTEALLNQINSENITEPSSLPLTSQSYTEAILPTNNFSLSQLTESQSLLLQKITASKPQSSNSNTYNKFSKNSQLTPNLPQQPNIYNKIINQTENISDNDDDDI